MLPQRPLLLEKDDLEVGVLAGCQTGDDLLQAPDKLQELAACRWSSTCLLTGNISSRQQGRSWCTPVLKRDSGPAAAGSTVGVTELQNACQRVCTATF